MLVEVGDGATYSVGRPAVTVVPVAESSQAPLIFRGYWQWGGQRTEDVELLIGFGGCPRGVVVEGLTNRVNSRTEKTTLVVVDGQLHSRHSQILRRGVVGLGG